MTTGKWIQPCLKLEKNLCRLHPGNIINFHHVRKVQLSPLEDAYKKNDETQRRRGKVYVSLAASVIKHFFFCLFLIVVSWREQTIFRKPNERISWICDVVLFIRQSAKKEFIYIYVTNCLAFWQKVVDSWRQCCQQKGNVDPKIRQRV